MFRRRSAGPPDGTAQDSPGTRSPDSPGPERSAEPRVKPAAQTGKGRPTPKRSEAERGRYQPIGGQKRYAGPRTPADKAKEQSERSRRYDAMKRGEDWALNSRDRGPVRRLARDYVDSKRRITEYYMFILVILVATLFLRSTYTNYLVLALILVMVVDALLLRRGLRKLVAERLPGESSSGLTYYAVSRAIQIRRMRIPRPQVKPGEKV